MVIQCTLHSAHHQIDEIVMTLEEMYLIATEFMAHTNTMYLFNSNGSIYLDHRKMPNRNSVLAPA